jgi:hypothetical protein
MDQKVMRCSSAGCAGAAVDTYVEVKGRVLKGELNFCPDHSHEYWHQFNCHYEEDPRLHFDTSRSAYFDLVLVRSINNDQFSLFMDEMNGVRRCRLDISIVDVHLLYWFLRGQLWTDCVFNCLINAIELSGEKLRLISIDGMDPRQGRLHASATISKGFDVATLKISANDAVTLSLVGKVPLSISEEVLAGYPYVVRRKNHKG